jgi:hypothetical protein
VGSLAAGGLLGAGLFALLRPALGLGTLVGAPAEVPVAIEPAIVLATLVLMTVVVSLGLVLGAAIGRRVVPAAALRGGFE